MENTFLLVKMLLEASKAAKNGRGRRSGHGKGLNPKLNPPSLELLCSFWRLQTEHQESTSRAPAEHS